MNKFVFGALAFSASTLSFANGSEEWPTLDREIEHLASSLSQGGGGLGVSGFVRTSYASSSDVSFPDPQGIANGDPTATNDLGGFSMDNVRLEFSGSVGEFNVFVSVEGSNDLGMGAFGGIGTIGAATVLDAWAAMNITEDIAVTLGTFRLPFQGDSLRDEDETLFIDRSITGDRWAGRDAGVMFSGNFDALGWWLAAQNGVDGAGDDLVITARAAFNAMGTGFGAVEGAYGAGDESNLTIAAGYTDDGNLDDGEAISIDADYARGALSFGFSMVDYGDGVAGAPLPVGAELATTPWDGTVSFMVSPDTWELAARWDDFDDSNDTTMITLGLNRYLEGHNAKWQINYSTIDSDMTANEIDMIQLGLTVSV